MPCRAAASRTASGDGSGRVRRRAALLVEPHADLLEEPLGSRRLHDREEASGDGAGVPVAVGHTGRGMHACRRRPTVNVSRSPLASPVNSSSPSRT